VQSNGTLFANLNPAGTTCSNIVQKDRGGTRGFGNAHAESESGKIKDGFCALEEGTSEERWKDLYVEYWQVRPHGNLVVAVSPQFSYSLSSSGYWAM